MLVKLQMSPLTINALVVKLVVGCKRFLLANIYLQPGVNITAFLDKLSDMEESSYLRPEGSPSYWVI